MRQNRHYILYMSYLAVFEVLARDGVDVFKFFRVGAGVLKPKAVVESESVKCESAHPGLESL